MSTSILLLGVTTASPTYGPTIDLGERPGPFSLTLKSAGTGAITATVVLYVSNTNVSTDWSALNTFTINGTTTTVDQFAWSARYKYIRMGVTAIAGTGHTINAILNA